MREREEGQSVDRESLGREELLEVVKGQDLRIRQLEQELERERRHEALTGLLTRKYFTEEAGKDVNVFLHPGAEKRRKKPRPTSFLFCDIDHFKRVNDTYGHEAGDVILKEVARVLQENVRDRDLICRWGGEEMVIALRESTEANAAKKAKKLLKSVEEIVAGRYPEYPGLKVTLSIGVAATEPGVDFKTLVERRADQAMYAAKQAGRNQVKKFSELREEKG